MTDRVLVRTALLSVFLASIFASPLWAGMGACSAKSGEQTTALVELYTSEGCSSCPPADKWVRDLTQKGFGPSQVVPLAFHVDYWDYIGWKDRFASPDYTARQRTMARLSRLGTIYTPQVLLSGKDARRAIRNDTFDKNLKEITSAKARADISLEIGQPENGSVEVTSNLNIPHPDDRAAAMAFIAVYESGLASEVKAGENRGVRLEHDYVVRRLLGPMKLESSGKLEIQRTLALDPAWKTNDTGIVVFVQNQRTGEIMQALQLPLCGS